jgi:hypothetical protein
MEYFLLVSVGACDLTVAAIAAAITDEGRELNILDPMPFENLKMSYMLAGLGSLAQIENWRHVDLDRASR